MHAEVKAMRQGVHVEHTFVFHDNAIYILPIYKIWRLKMWNKSYRVRFG